MNVFDGPTHSTVLKTILLPIFSQKIYKTQCRIN